MASTAGVMEVMGDCVACLLSKVPFERKTRKAAREVADGGADPSAEVFLIRVQFGDLFGVQGVVFSSWGVKCFRLELQNLSTMQRNRVAVRVEAFTFEVFESAAHVR